MPKRYHCIQVRNGCLREIDDEIVSEDQFRIFYNDKPVTDMIATNDQLKELGVGFVVSEGLTKKVDKVKIDHDRILVYSDVGCKVIPDQREYFPSGGTGIPQEPAKVISSLTITPNEIGEVTRAIDNDIWHRTGAVHCAVLFSDANCVVTSSDVGMHNAVDKVIGHALLSGINLSRCVIGCTGRQSAAIVKKSANAGIPIIVSWTAATDKGIATAKTAGITLICFSRDNRFTIYSHPERVQGIGQHQCQ